MFSVLKKDWWEMLNNAVDQILIQTTGLDPSLFKWETAPLTMRSTTAAIFISYLAVVFSIKALNLSLKLKVLFVIHNALLCISSAILLGMFIEILTPMLLKKGLFYCMCSPEAFTQRLSFLYYVNYLFKYYEFVDTLFLALKGKPLAFLHVYHHASGIIHSETSYGVVLL